MPGIDMAGSQKQRPAAPDRLLPLLWRLIKVLFRYVRFLYGAFVTILFLINLMDLYFGRAALCALLAFVIWPGRYGPFTYVIEHQRLKRRSPNSPSAAS